MSKNKIPSEEEFARAKAAMREDDRGLDDACDNVLERFNIEGLHEIIIIYSANTNSFGSYVFYRWNREIKKAEKSGLSDQIKKAVFEELEKVGRGNKDNLNIVFEFDSHENVEKNFDGNYYERLC